MTFFYVKNLFFSVTMNGSPGMDSKMPKSPFWIGTESTSGILFLEILDLP
jgi:hypothetical protein